MLQYPATESNPSGSTQPTAGIETEADRSSLLGLSEYGSEGFEYVSDDSDRAALHKRAHPHEVINAHYPHRTALSAPRAAHGLAFSTSLNAFESTVGVAEILDPTGAPRTTQFPARAFDTFLDAGPKQVELSWEGPVGVALSSSLTADDTSYLSIWTSATIFWTSVGFAPGTSDIPPATSVVYATSILVLTSTSEPPRRQTSYETYNTPSSSQWQTTDENYTSISSSQWQTTSESLTATSGSHPMTSQSHTPSLGIIAGSAAGGTTVLIAVIFTALCVMRRRARKRSGNRRAYNENEIAHSDSNSHSSLQANLETSHEHEVLVVIPVNHDDEIKSTLSVPLSTVAVPLSTTAIVPSVPVSNTLPTSLPRSTGLPTSPPGEPVPVASANLRLDSGSCSDPNRYQHSCQDLHHDPYPHSDYCSVHEADHPCPSYSCISLTENNYSIGSISRRRAGRDGSEGRGRQVEGDGDGQGRTRGRGARGRSRSSSRPIVRRMNIPSRSTARARAVSRAGTWMTVSDRSVETAPPPSYDFANQ